MPIPRTPEEEGEEEEAEPKSNRPSAAETTGFLVLADYRH